MYKESRTGFLDLIETKTKDLALDLGLIDDSLPPLGSVEYNRIKLKTLMEEDCISMRNEPLDPLETVDDMEFIRDQNPGNN